MKLVIGATVLAVGCVSLGGCATVTRGANTAWEVKTSPPGAAVRTSDGLACDSTPCTLRVPRKASFTATITKPGYQPVDVAVSHDISTSGGIAFAGNILIGGILGATVDLVTGAYNDLTPNNVDLKLERSFFSTAATSPGHSISYGATAWTPVSASLEQRAPTSVEGRVVTLRVQPDGSMREYRELPN